MHRHQVPDRRGLEQHQEQVQVHGGQPGRLLGRPGVAPDAKNYEEDDGDKIKGPLLVKKFV